jgi:HlyD family secretion protein
MRSVSYSTTLSTVLCVALVIALAGCNKKEEEKEPVVKVQTAVAQKTTMEDVISAEAILYPRNQASITPKIAAPVRQFYVNRGSRVHKGQLLAVLENRDIAASVLENRGALEQAQATFSTTTGASLPDDMKKAEMDARAAREALVAQQKLYDSRRMLFEQGALPRKELDQAAVALVQARAQSEIADQHLGSMQSVGKSETGKLAAGQLASAQGKYAGATAQLSYTEIRSPIDGVVTDRPVWTGETPAQGVPLLTVMDLSTVVARAHNPQEQAARLKPGDAAVISSSSAQDISGKVMLVSPALDPNSTTVEVWIEAKNEEGALRPGSAVRVTMNAETIHDAIAIPQSAALKTPEGSSVMVVGLDQRAHKTDVELGLRNGDEVQVTKGLNAGQIVITSGAYGLPDNTKIITENDPNKTAAAAAGAR